VRPAWGASAPSLQGFRATTLRRVSSLASRALRAASLYIKENPREVVRVARQAFSLKLGVPLDALRWAIRELSGDNGPRDVVLEARDTGIYLEASLVVMKTPIRATTTLIFEQLDVRPDAILVDLRVQGLKLTVLDPSVGTPIAALIQSGSLDTSRPGDLLSFIPQKPPIILEARGDRFRLDLLRLPALSQDRARMLVRALAPLANIRSVRTDEDHVDIAFVPLPEGPGAAVEGIKSLF
jgi:hypothetical protein